MRQVRRDVQYLAGRDVDDLFLVLAEPEAQRALEDVRQLLVLVRVRGDETSLLEVDVREHHPLGRDQPPAEVGLEHLLRKVFPAIADGLAHATLTSALPRFSPFSIPINARGAFSRPSVTVSR